MGSTDSQTGLQTAGPLHPSQVTQAGTLERSEMGGQAWVSSAESWLGALGDWSGKITGIKMLWSSL